MRRNEIALLRDAITVLVVVAGLATIVVAARRHRRHDHVFDGARQVVRVEGVAMPQLPAVPDKAALQKATDELKRAEESARESKEKLEQVKRDIEEKKQELQRISDESEAKAAQTKREIDEAARDLQTERDKLEKLARETDERAESAKQEVAQLKAARDEQLNAAAVSGVTRSFERGKTVDMQTRFNPLTKRDPAYTRGMPAIPGSRDTVNGNKTEITEMNYVDTGLGEFSRGRQAINMQTAEAMHYDNRVRATETFFEMRRINRAARAQEAGPRPTMDQIVKYSVMQAPRRLTSLELDPFTGDIRWPLALTDTIYQKHTLAVEARFKERALNGGSVDYQQFARVEKGIAGLKDRLKDNLTKYPGKIYGESRTFLDSLLYEFQLPLD